MYALLSVSDKDGIVAFAKGLVELGYDILSTGGTLKLLESSGIKAIDVSAYTQSAEMFEGRVKTLHPKIHGGILYRRDNNSDVAVAKAKEIADISLVCVNLYPFKQTIESTNDFATIIENIDIGGPSLIRAGAKNYKSVLVITDKSDYEFVLDSIKEGKNTLELRQAMMIKAFAHTAEYDTMIANYMQGRFSESSEGFAKRVFISAQKAYSTKYGENPHQQGALYSFSNFWQKHFIIHKGEPSFNNFTDINAALKIATHFGESKALCIVKHNNPCGFAIGESELEAYKNALKCDSISAYGGVVALNGVVDRTLAEEMNKTFIEVLVAREISQEALEIFASKKRMKIFSFNAPLPQDSYDFKHISGGFLYQQSDVISEAEITNATLVTKKCADSRQLADLKIAYIIAALTKSNCVTYVKDSALVGIGMGMTSRVDAARAAMLKAKDMGLDLGGCVCASEAFFPFRDSVDMARDMGVSAIIQPGGSIRDNEVIAACDEANIAMYLTHTRHFLH